MIYFLDVSIMAFDIVYLMARSQDVGGRSKHAKEPCEGDPCHRDKRGAGRGEREDVTRRHRGGDSGPDAAPSGHITKHSRPPDRTEGLHPFDDQRRRSVKTTAIRGYL